MIVRNVLTEKPKEGRVESLYEQFGNGVHLIVNLSNHEYRLLVIRNPTHVPMVIVETDSVGGFSDSYPNFFKDYKYIKKLESHELIVDLGVKK